MRALIAPRGMGKTALANEIARIAQTDLGWVTLMYQVHSSDDLTTGLVAALQRATVEATRFGRLRRRPETLTAGMNLGVAKAEVTSSPPDAPANLTIEQAVLELGNAVAKRQTGALVVVDEVQNADPRGQLAELGAAMQRLNMTALPVAVLLVGLPVSRQRLIEGSSFLERLDFTTITSLSHDATIAALAAPLTSIGVTADPPILDQLATATAGYPYAVQLIGSEAVELLDDDATITPEIADQSAHNTYTALRENVLEPRWSRLGDLQRSYLTEAAAQVATSPDQVASTSTIAEALQRTITQLSTTRDQLINHHHLLEPAGTGFVRFSLPGMADWIVDQHTHTVDKEPPDLAL